MNSFRWIAAGIVAVAVFVVGFALGRITLPGQAPSVHADTAGNAAYNGMIPAAEMLRVPVTGIYPGGTPVGLNPHMKNPLANDPDAAQRGMQAFNKLNCSGCHMANGGGGMGPALSDHIWLHGDSPANLYLDIAQGRGNGMPAWGAMLPDRTIWELVAYIQSISDKPEPTFGTTTSGNPPSPSTEQVPAEEMQSATPWKFTEPMPPHGEKPGSKAAKKATE